MTTVTLWFKMTAIVTFARLMAVVVCP